MKRLPTAPTAPLLAFLFVSLLGSLGGLAQTAGSDLELLTTLDAARFFDVDVNEIEVSILSETPAETREALLRLRFAEREDGTYSRIEFLEPEELAGQIYLNTPEAAYFFGPDLDFPIKTSATTEVFGDTAVAQTSGIRFAGSYTIAERRETVSEEGRARYELDLLAIDFSVAFQAITVIVDGETEQPITMTLYALSGIPFYEVAFEEYGVREETEDTYVRVQRIVNLLLVGRQTRTEIIGLAVAELDDALFDPNALGSGTPTE